MNITTILVLGSTALPIIAKEALVKSSEKMEMPYNIIHANIYRTSVKIPRFVYSNICVFAEMPQSSTKSRSSYPFGILLCHCNTHC